MSTHSAGKAFRSKESSCGLAYCGTQWHCGDAFGTVYALDSDNMREITSIDDEDAIVALAACPSGKECAVGKGTAVDLYGLPSFEASDAIVVRRDANITHIEYDNDGNHM